MHPTLEELAQRVLEFLQSDYDVTSLVDYSDIDADTIEGEREQSKRFNAAIAKVLRRAAEKANEASK